MEAQAKLKVEGFARLRICEDGRIVGDSGWIKNAPTNSFFLNFLGNVLGSQAASSRVDYAALGTGGAPATNDTTLAGEIMDSTQRDQVTKSVITTSAGNACTVRFYGTFASSDNFTTQAYDISNIGLFAATTTNATLAAGYAYSSSQVSTNQDVQYTYEWRFSTA